MKKFILLVTTMAVLLPLTASAQLSSRTRMFLQQQKSTTPSTAVRSASRVKAKNASINGSTVSTVQCFISLNNWSPSELEAEGVEVNSKFKDMVLAIVPVDKIETLARKHSVKQIDVERPVRLLTDVARQKTHTEDVQTLSQAALSAGLSQVYDGTGVVLGIIDDGIEFNHTAFKDASGNTRVKAVYMPNATSPNGGSKATIDGEKLPGYQYTTATQIGRLTCDDDEASHGTHTTGCAGGSRVTTTGLYPNTTYSGMAPGVDLVLCGCGSELSDAAIANSAKYLANYAKEQGKPCVISISLGSNTGPHDGTSPLCRAYDEIAEQYGCIILLAAGNEADVKCSLSKQLSSSSDYLGTVISPTSYFSSSYGSSYYCYSWFDVWNNTSDELQLQFVVLNSSGNVVYTSDKMSSGIISASALSSYFDPYIDSSLHEGITVESAQDSNNGRYGLSVVVDLGRSSKGYKLGMLVYGKTGNMVSMWNDAQFSEFTSLSSSSYTLEAGDGTCSICDDVTGHKTISVGAYASRLRFPYNYGNSYQTLTNASYSEQDIAFFSSYGTDFNGIQHPFVAAPGHTVVSSINRYDSSHASSEAAYRLRLGSNAYDYWEYMSGTSMATPVAAGIVALYLQAAPTLDVDDVKDVIRQTATHDTYTDGQNSIKFGVGKIDALEGIKYILANSDKPINQKGDVNGDGQVNVADVTALVNIVLGKDTTPHDTATVDVNGDGQVNVADVTALVNLILGRQQQP